MCFSTQDAGAALAPWSRRDYLQVLGIRRYLLKKLWNWQDSLWKENSLIHRKNTPLFNSLYICISVYLVDWKKHSPGGGRALFEMVYPNSTLWLSFQIFRPMNFRAPTIWITVLSSFPTLRSDDIVVARLVVLATTWPLVRSLVLAASVSLSVEWECCKG